MRWTPELVEQAANVFRNHVDYRTALDEVNRTVCMCTESALRNAFKAAGLGSPATLLRVPTLGEAPQSRSVAPDYQGSQPDGHRLDSHFPPPPGLPTEVMPTVPSSGCEPRRVDSKQELTLFIPDCHVPYEDPDAFELMLRVGRFIKPKRVVILGDFADAESVSRHAKAPDAAIHFDSEVAAVNKRLGDVDALGAEEKDFVEGNHCARLRKYVNSNAIAFHKMVCLTIPELFRLPDRGWSFTPYMDTLKLGTLSVSHDFGDAGPYSAKRAAEAVDGDCIFGHTHRMMQHHGVSRKTGEPIVATSGGWLGAYSAITYQHRAKALRDWSHGCCVGYTRADGSMRIEMVRFVDGKAKVDGQRV